MKRLGLIACCLIALLHLPTVAQPPEVLWQADLPIAEDYWSFVNIAADLEEDRYYIAADEYYYQGYDYVERWKSRIYVIDGRGTLLNSLISDNASYEKSPKLTVLPSGNIARMVPTSDYDYDYDRTFWGHSVRIYSPTLEFLEDHEFEPTHYNEYPSRDIAALHTAPGQDAARVLTRNIETLPDGTIISEQPFVYDLVDGDIAASVDIADYPGFDPEYLAVSDTRLVLADNQTIRCYPVNGGPMLWSYTSGGASIWHVRLWPNGSVIYGQSNSNIGRIAPDGTPLWQSYVGDHVRGLEARPDGTIIALRPDGVLFSFDRDGETLWYTDISTYNGRVAMTSTADGGILVAIAYTNTPVAELVRLEGAIDLDAAIDAPGGVLPPDATHLPITATLRHGYGLAAAVSATVRLVHTDLGELGALVRSIPIEPETSDSLSYPSLNLPLPVDRPSGDYQVIFDVQRDSWVDSDTLSFTIESGAFRP